MGVIGYFNNPKITAVSSSSQKGPAGHYRKFVGLPWGSIVGGGGVLSIQTNN